MRTWPDELVRQIRPPSRENLYLYSLKTLTSLNEEVRPFFPATIAFGVYSLFLPLAITAFGGPEGYFNLAIIAFGAFEFIVPHAIIA